MEKKLYRSRTDSTIAGVCGGLGEYFNVDPTFMRILFVLLLFADGVGLLAYIIGWIIMPQEPMEAVNEKVVADEGEIMEKKKEMAKGKYAGWNKYIPGAVLVLIGLFFVLRNNFWWWNFGEFWPMLLILVGVFLIFKRSKKRNNEVESNQNEGSHDESGQA